MVETDGKTVQKIQIDFVFLLHFPKDENPSKQELTTIFLDEDGEGQVFNQLKATNTIWGNEFANFLSVENKALIKDPSENRLVNFYHTFKTHMLVIFQISILFVVLTYVSELTSFSDNISTETRSAESRLFGITRSINTLEVDIANRSKFENDIILFDGKVGSDKWRNIVDDAQRHNFYAEKINQESKLQYLNEIKGETLDELEQLKFQKNSGSTKSKINSYFGKLLQALKWIISQKWIFVLGIILGTFALIARIYEKKLYKINKSYIWIGKPKSDINQLGADDFIEGIIISALGAVVISVLGFFLGS